MVAASLRLQDARLAVRTQPPVFVGVATSAGAVAPAPVQARPPVKPALTPQIQDVKLIEPAVAMRIAAIPFFVANGVERGELKVPVAPSAEVSDTTVFEDPADDAIKYFVTGYRLAEERTTLGQQFAVKMVTKEQHWELSVAIAKAAPDSVLQAHPGAREFPHEVSLLLRYRQRVNGQPAAVAEAPMTEARVEGNHVHAVLSIEGLSKRDEIHRALIDPELACTLVMRRKVKVAVPVPAAMMAPARPQSRPRLGLSGTLYRETERVLDLPLPFTFDPTLHRYVFEAAGAAAPATSQGLLRRQITWNGKQHVYYQDDGARNLFYYAPDTFKLARRPAAPHEPLVSVRFDSEDGSRERMQVTCTYCAVPVVNRDRLVTTLPALKALVPPDLLAASGGIELEPLLPDPAKIVLRLAYPGADAQGGPFATRPQATADLRAGIVDSVTMTLDQFRALYDALFSTGQLLFTGGVRFDMGGTGEEVPFRLRLNDTAEPLGVWTAASDGTDLVIDFVNEIESPLRVHRLEGVVLDASTLAVKPLEPANGGYPIEIAPSGGARFRLSGAAGLSVKDLDLSKVEAVPDREELYKILLDPSTTTSYSRAIKVKAFPQTFIAAADAPDQQVMSVVVDFEDGTTVELTSEVLEASVNVPVPLSQFVLGQESSQRYRYKVTVVRLSAATADEEWRTGESGILFPAVVSR